MLEDAQAGPVSTLPADVEDKVLPVGPRGEVSVRIYRPKGAKGALPVVMYFHGGGWVLGSKNTHDRLLRDLVNGTPAAFVFLSATSERLKGLPPALIIVDENDVLRDEGEAYARKLLQSGADVTAVRFLATRHDFVMLNALADTPASKAAIQLASEKLIAGLYR